jgi:hypothetical protein
MTKEFSKMQLTEGLQLSVGGHCALWYDFRQY